MTSLSVLVPPCSRRRPSSRQLLVIASALVVGLAGPALAHDQGFPISADSVQLRTDGEAGSEVFEFRSSDATTLPIPKDPAIYGSALLVVGYGDNGGRSPLMTLDLSKWASPEEDVYLYSNADAERPGGVTSVLVSGSVLEIDASGENWSFDPAGPLDSLAVHYRMEQEWYCAEFSTDNSSVISNAAGQFEATAALSPGVGSCDVEICGNGEREAGEECDDGNLMNDDGCDNDCTIGICTAETFDTTFEGIRRVIFEEPLYACAGCHTTFTPQGGLSLAQSLSNEQVYENLMGLDGLGIYSDIAPTLKLVEISEPALSVLYLKLLKKRLDAQGGEGYEGPEVGGGMPEAGQQLSGAHEQVIREWIRAGAPLDKTVIGSGALLGTCLPPADPLKVAAPDPPDPSDGFQLRQPPWELAAPDDDSPGEDEVCLATYYDLSGLVPADAIIDCPSYFEFRKGCEDSPATSCDTNDDCTGDDNDCTPVKNAVNPESQCVTWNRQTLLQDPQSHHSIIQFYTGRAATGDEGWGGWTTQLEPTDPDYETQHGLACDPLEIDTENGPGYNPGCSSGLVSSIACGGFGPEDNVSFGPLGSNQIGFSGSQEPFYDQAFPPGAYSIMPMKGFVSWNSHAFNLTDTDTTMAQYLNLEFAKGDAERLYQTRGIFDARWIFAQYIQPYATQEICATYTIPQDANLFQMGSHTHIHGTKFRVWAPPNESCQPGCPTSEETGDPATWWLTAVGLCNEYDRAEVPLCEGPRDDEPIYYSTEYSDPVQLDFAPPILHPSPDAIDRTYLYCSYYDNESTDQSPTVKRRSLAPPTPDIGLGPIAQANLAATLGGPCGEETVRCLGGDYAGELCGVGVPDYVEDPADCSLGGGICDACPVHGGVTTSDEMFIFLGSYYNAVPEPTSSWLSICALLTLGVLVRRRRSNG